MAKAVTIKVKLVSSADTGFYYVAKKNSRTMTDKLVKKKYDPVARKHVEFREPRSSKIAARRSDFERGLVAPFLFAASRTAPCPGRGAAPFALLRRAGTQARTQDGPRISSAPRREARRAAQHPGNASDRGSKPLAPFLRFRERSCPGRGVALFALLRRSGTHPHSR